MKRIVTQPVKAVLKKLDLYSSYSLKTSGPLKDDGWFRSFKENKAIDADGNPIPWITYPAIEFLKKRVHKEMSVFEYGCGGSTLWWASRVKEVVSVEHDVMWYRKILPIIPNNVTLEHIELEYGGQYSQRVATYGAKFDLIVIDGRDRVNCALHAIQALKPDGIIIWDNSNIANYEDGYQFLYRNGFKKIEFVGLAPIVNWKAETGIFYRNINCLGI